MATLIKILMVLIPLIIITFGIMLIVQAGSFWLNVTGPVNVTPRELNFDHQTPFSATAFVPESFRPQNSPISFEVEIDQRDKSVDLNKQIVIEVSDNCDCLRVDNAKSTLVFNPQEAKTQSVTASLVARTPCRSSRNCELTVSAAVDQAQAIDKFSIPINAWFGHLLSIIELLFGLATTFMSLQELLAIFRG